jgi:hypothetical protein
MIGFPPADAYFRDQLQSRVYNEQLLNLTKDYFGFPVRPQFETKEMGESLAAKRERETKERQAAVKSAAQSHPTILEARSLFGGELGPIELTDSEEARDE